MVELGSIPTSSESAGVVPAEGQGGSGGWRWRWDGYTRGSWVAVRGVGPNEGEDSQEDDMHTTGEGVLSDKSTSDLPALPLTSTMMMC